MGKSLQEFVDKYSSVQFLEQNLRANMAVYCDSWSEEDKETFLRMNMIMIRQCLQDFGAE